MKTLTFPSWELEKQQIKGQAAGENKKEEQISLLFP